MLQALINFNNGILETSQTSRRLSHSVFFLVLVKETIQELREATVLFLHSHTQKLKRFHSHDQRKAMYAFFSRSPGVALNHLHVSIHYSKAHCFQHLKYVYWVVLWPIQFPSRIYCFSQHLYLFIFYSIPP